MLSNTLMSYIDLEDDTGAMELIAFQKALDTGGAYVRDNAPLVVSGRISVRDEKEPQLMVDVIKPITEIEKLKDESSRPAPVKTPSAGAKLWVKLESENDPALKRIELILTMFPGTQQMIIYCQREKKRIGAPCVIHEALVDELKEMLGSENVVIK